MKLVVGLGNPGNEYEGTRHNVGFSFLDFYLKSKGYVVNWSNKNNGDYFKAIILKKKHN